MGMLLDIGYMPDPGLVSIPGTPSPLIPSLPSNDIPPQVQRDPLGRKKETRCEPVQGKAKGLEGSDPCLCPSLSISPQGHLGQPGKWVRPPT